MLDMDVRMRTRNLLVEGVTHGPINHIQNFGLDKFKVLSISRWSSTDDIIHFNIIIFATHTT